MMSNTQVHWPMKTSRNLNYIFVLALTVTLAPSGFGLSADEPATAPASTAQNRHPSPASGPYALEIVEGTIVHKGAKLPATLGQVVDALRELYPNVNIVASPEVTDLMVADLKLRSTEIEETLEAVRIASGERFIWRNNDAQPGAIDPTTGLPLPVPQPPKEAALYLITANPNALPVKPKREVEVFNLSGYIAYSTAHANKMANDDGAINQSLMMVQDIVRQTLDRVYQQEGATKLDYQFHSGASLLIVIGPRDEIEVARKVIEALPGQPTSVSTRFRPEPAPGGPNADAMDKQREAFMRRYGLMPQKPPAGGAENPKPDTQIPK
jgi:hypothetical protein